MGIDNTKTGPGQVHGVRYSCLHRSGLMVAITVLGLTLGCSTSNGPITRKARTDIPAEARSGFLEDYSRLQAIPGEPAVLRWFLPEVDWSKYTKFMVDPVEFRVPPSYQDVLQPRAEVVVAATEYFHEALIRELGNEFEIVDEPGAGVVRVSGALTAVVPTARQLEAWQFVPVALVATSVGEVTGARGKDVLVFMEGEMSDSINGKLLGQVIQGRISAVSGTGEILDVTPEDLMPVLDFWARELPRQIEQQ